MNDRSTEVKEDSTVRVNRWKRWWRAIAICFLSALMIGIVIVLLLFEVRTRRLAEIPVMEEPFDASEFVKWNVPADQDAFTEYRRAHELREKINNDYRSRSESQPDNWDVVMTSGWAAADESLKRWFDAHHEALDAWRRGTTRDRGRYLSPATCDFHTPLPVVESLRVFAYLALMEQVRCLEEGRLDEAWEWARAIYRSGAHCGDRGCMIQGLVGAELHRRSTSGMNRWSRQPGLRSDRLKAALAAVEVDDSLYESRSNMLKAQYLLTKNQFEQHWLEFGGGNDGSWISTKRLAKWESWFVGEPELAIRTFCQTLANQIRDIDRPVATRQPSVGHFIMIFDSDPSVVRLPGEMSGIELDRKIDCSKVFHLLAPAIDKWDEAMLHQEARRAAIKVVLAAQAYQRDHGSFPNSLPQLVPNYLRTVPLDPCDPAGESLRYRLDEKSKAIVWSVGCDGSDDDGQLERAAVPRDPASTVPQIEETNSTATYDVGFRIELIAP